MHRRDTVSPSFNQQCCNILRHRSVTRCIEFHETCESGRLKIKLSFYPRFSEVFKLVRIKQSSVRSLTNPLRVVLPNAAFRITVPVGNGAIARLGLSTPPTVGDTLLPPIVGKVTKYNAEGEYITRKDLPKESRLVGMIEWTWKEWHGRHDSVTKTEDRPVYRDCYPREFREPPCCEITCAAANGSDFFVSEEFRKNAADADRALHTINIFLELFGECEVRHSDLQAITPPNVRRVNWELLPPGAHPWSQARAHIQPLIKGKNARSSGPILHRLDKLAAYNPDEVYGGSGGFLSYLAYLYNAKGVVVLESVEFNNATYVFDLNWQQVSQLSKADILRKGLQKARVIHSEKWHEHMHALLK